MRPWLAALAVAVLLAAAPATALAHEEAPPCEDTADCEEGFVCYIGGCYPACTTDADCVEGEEVCVDDIACTPTTDHLNEEAEARDGGGCAVAGAPGTAANGALALVGLAGVLLAVRARTRRRHRR